jgi:hypothetical protein
VRPISLILFSVLPLLFVGCNSTTLDRTLRPVAHELPLAQINHQTGVADRVEIAIWRDGTVLQQYDNNRYLVSHAMPETLQQLKDRIAECDFDDVSTERYHTTKAPLTTLFVAGRRQATRPVAIFSQHNALASAHELTGDGKGSNKPYHLLWAAIRENIENAAEHTMNPKFIPADFNSRRLWKTGRSGQSVSVLTIYGDKIDNKPKWVSINHEGMFPDEL